MGQNKEELKRLLAFIDTLVKQPGNEDFAAGLRALLPELNQSIKTDTEYIRKALGIRGIQTINYSVITDDFVRNQLVIDNLRMEDVLLDTTLSDEDKWYLYCTYAHYQSENLINYFYNTAFSDLEAIFWYLDHYTSSIKNPFDRKKNGATLEVIAAFYKTIAFMNEHFPYVSGITDYTSYTFKQIREVRNEYVHRSGISTNKPNAALNEVRLKSSFSAIRRSLTDVLNKVIEASKPINKIFAYEAKVATRLASGVSLTFDNHTIMLDNKLYVKHSTALKQQDEMYVIVRNNNIIDLYFVK